MQIRVSCPGCGTRFRLDESKVPPEGFRATCSVCSAVIAIEPLPQDTTAPSPSGDRPPAPKPRPLPTDAGASPSPALQPADPPPEVTTPPDTPPEVTTPPEPPPEVTTPPEPPPEVTTPPDTPPEVTTAPDPPPEVTTPPEPPPEVTHQTVHHGTREELLKEVMLDALSQRRKTASDMDSEHVRLREVVEQQQMVVSRLVDAVSKQIPAQPATEQGGGGGGGGGGANERLRARQEELVKKLLEAERERLEMASKMASELSGLREVVEQQQRVVSQLVDTVSTQPPAQLDTEQAEGNKKLLARQEELLERMLDSERERREMASEMTKKLFGFREVVEQQQRVVSRLVDGVAAQIPAPPDTGQVEGNEELRARQEDLEELKAALDRKAEGDEEALARQEDLEEELKAAVDRKAVGNKELLARQEDLEEELQKLKAALDGEKEIVNRLRRGKLDLERRATAAEATIEHSQKPGFLKRLLKRDGD